MIVIEAKVSWSMVYYSSDFLAIWIWHLQNSKMSKSTLFLVQNCEGCMLGIMYHMVVHDSKRSAQVWSIFEVSRGFWPLRPKYLGQRYTILQTFRPFGNDIFKIPKCQNQLRFWFKLAPSAWNHVSHGDTWFQALGASLVAFRRFPKGFKSPRETHRSPTKHFFWI